MKKRSSINKPELPYSLLLDSQQCRAAAYNNTHKIITGDASQELIAYALQNTAKSQPFDEKKHALGAIGASQPRPLPAWATPDVLDRCVIVWIKRPTGEDPDEAWLAIPPR